MCFTSGLDCFRILILIFFLIHLIHYIYIVNPWNIQMSSCLYADNIHNVVGNLNTRISPKIISPTRVVLPPPPIHELKIRHLCHFFIHFIGVLFRNNITPVTDNLVVVWDHLRPYNTWFVQIYLLEYACFMVIPHVHLGKVRSGLSKVYLLL